MPDTAPVQNAAAPLPRLIDRLGLTRQSGGHSGGGAAATVVGLQWGDEGKGKIVDLLTADFDAVARYNGGANAGHSVQVGKDRYALHLIPSGILYRDKLNVLGNGVVVDPAVLLKEAADLRSRGVHIAADNLKISARAHVVLPYHKTQDALMDAAIGKARGDASKIGTTGRGIGPCYADKALRSTAVRVGDLLDRDALGDKLTHIVAIKNQMLAALAAGVGQEFTPFDASPLADEFAGYGNTLRDHICDTAPLLHKLIAQGKHVLFEGANATLLDIDHGTYPFVTSSNCSALGVHTGTGVPPAKVGAILGIMKAYATRVGGGPMPTELFDETGSRIREAGREYGTTTGRPRRCGWLDLVAVRYSAAINGATHLAIMLLDVLWGFDRLQVCTGYVLDGKTLDWMPENADDLARVEMVYQFMPGWKQPIDTCSRFEDLPPEAQNYVKVIEQAVGVPVAIVSVGPRRDQTIVR